MVDAFGTSPARELTTRAGDHLGGETGVVSMQMRAHQQDELPRRDVHLPERVLEALPSRLQAGAAVDQAVTVLE